MVTFLMPVGMMINTVIRLSVTAKKGFKILTTSAVESFQLLLFEFEEALYVGTHEKAHYDQMR